MEIELHINSNTIQELLETLDKEKYIEQLLISDTDQDNGRVINYQISEGHLLIDEIFSHNGIRELILNCVKELSSYFITNFNPMESLVSLGMVNVELEDDDIDTLLNAGLGNIKYLVLADNNLSNNSAHMFSRILTKSELELKELDLSANEISNDGVLEIIKSLKSNEKLLSLKISGNLINDKIDLNSVKDALNSNCTLKMIELDSVLLSVMQKVYLNKLQEIDKISSFFIDQICDAGDVFTNINSSLSISVHKYNDSFYFTQNYDFLEKIVPSFVNYLINQSNLLPNELLNKISSYLSSSDVIQMLAKYSVEQEETIDFSVYGQLNKIQRVDSSIDVHSNIDSQYMETEYISSIMGDSSRDKEEF